MGSRASDSRSDVLKATHHRVDGRVEAKLAEMGLVLPAQFKAPAGLAMPFAWVRVRGHRGYISGHIPQAPDGSPAGPFGKVGVDLTAEQGYQAARLVALAHLGSLKRALGNLDRVTAWLRVFAMVNAAPDFTQTPLVTNGYTDLILELYGVEAGQHARSSIPMMLLPLNAPVNCEAEVEIDGPAYQSGPVTDPSQWVAGLRARSCDCCAPLGGLQNA